MKSWLEFAAHFARGVGSAVLSLVLWTVWLGLVLLLAFQLYIVTANELAIPDFVLRRIEARLEQSGLHATFGRTSFDPSGRVLVENVRFTLSGFTEPVLTCGSAFVRVNPWFLIVGRIEPRDIRLAEITAFAPAMVSPSGQAEELISNLDVLLEPDRHAVVIQQASARVAGVPVTAHGTIALVPTHEASQPALAKVEEFIAKHFANVCRQALAVAEQVKQFDEPALDLEFAPSEGGATTIHVQVLARGARLARPMALSAKEVRASTRLLLFGEAPPSTVEFSAAEVKMPGDIRIDGLNARIVGRWRRDERQFDLRELDGTADTILAPDVDVRGVSAQLIPRLFPQAETQAVAHVLGAPLAIRAEGDLRSRNGLVQFEGAISPRVLDVISRRLNVNVRKYFEFTSLAAERAEARFGDKGEFERLTARVSVPQVNAYGVRMEDGRVELELDRQRLFAPRAFARVGENFARGSYEHDLKTNQYRFLLDGRLRPLAIAEWFRDWWTNFFQQLEFPVAPPLASVDVRGSWRDGSQSNVFVFADVPKAIVRGTELDRVRTRLFIRPAFYDGLEMLVTRGTGNAHGRFTYIGNPVTHAWHTLELGLDSTLDLRLAAQLLGPAGATALAPFRLAQPPFLKVRGQFAGPEAPGGVAEKMRIEARTAGEFRYHEFPLQDVSFIATIDRDEIVLDNVEAMFGGGVAAGHARVSGIGEQKRLGFDFALEDASLGRVATALAEFFAAKKGAEASPPGKFVQEKANVRLNFAASAEGRYDDVLSFRGDGSTVLRGAEIGEVPLLGTLSELLKFTALRFTEARANFKIEGSKIVFPEVTLRGANSAIDAHGAYALDRRELDFSAKIFPFQESESLIKNVVGAVLSPLSNALEVKLTGSLAKPQWAFAMGPTNILRSLATGGDAKTEAPPAEKEVTSTRPTTDSQLPPAAAPKS